MSIDIVTYTQHKIMELESIKENTKFFQDNEDKVTLSLDELFSKSNICPSVIPVDFLMTLHNSSSVRKLYVFDCLDIKDTKGEYPEGMSMEAYYKFVNTVDQALATIGLSVNMKMTDDQREYFDNLVTKREEDPDNHEQMNYDYWYRLIRNVVFASVPLDVRPFLQRKHASVLNGVTEYVIKKCDGRRQEVGFVRKTIEEYFANNDIKYSDIRAFDYEEIYTQKVLDRRR